MHVLFLLILSTISSIMRLLIERFNMVIRPSENWLSDGLMLIYA
ncbi:hypothetical protein NEISUBOT_04770 [Neisseria subflava NJ9703]|uniref:Uncharacterized protein n=1 Tax=Neisseria subflava NJ9703 TaxID=546268 RepID=A0A9W5IQ85_NEISU|nr:hypothetical protein NEISUBOT_04770 [Neisseria subflava NJ9703]